MDNNDLLVKLKYEQLIRRQIRAVIISVPPQMFPGDKEDAMRQVEKDLDAVQIKIEELQLELKL